MNNEFKNNDFTDDLPKPASYNTDLNESKEEVVLGATEPMSQPEVVSYINEENNPENINDINPVESALLEEVDLPDIDLSEVDLTKIEVPNDALSIEPEQKASSPLPNETEEIVSEPLPEVNNVSENDPLPEVDPAAVFGFDEPKEIDADELLKTNPLKKVSLDTELPPTPTLPTEDFGTEEMVEPKVKKSSTAITIIVVLIILLGAIYGIYKALSVGDANVKTKPEDEPSSEQPVVEVIKDNEIYADKIVTDKLTNIELFANRNQVLTLFVNEDGKLNLVIHRKNAQINESNPAYLVKYTEAQKIKNMFKVTSCKLEKDVIYILTEDGKLSYLDPEENYEEIFNILKDNKDEELATFNLKSNNVLASVNITDFTTISDSMEGCGFGNIYVLTEKNEINRLETKNNLVTLGQRYKGHVNFLKQKEIDYLIYPDKTFSDINMKKLVDKNGQNHKFEKVISGLLPINDTKYNYAFIGTDNKLYYPNNSLYTFTTNDKEVKEVIELQAKSADNQSEHSIVLIKYVDDQEEKLISDQADLNVLNIQDLIDDPIN